MNVLLITAGIGLIALLFAAPGVIGVRLIGWRWTGAIYGITGAVVVVAFAAAFLITAGLEG